MNEDAKHDTRADRAASDDHVGWIYAARWIVENGQARHVNRQTGRFEASGRRGVLLDAFTASMLCRVYDALNDSNRRKFVRLPVGRAAAIGWQLVKGG